MISVPERGCLHHVRQRELAVCQICSDLVIELELGSIGQLALYPQPLAILRGLVVST